MFEKAYVEARRERLAGELNDGYRRYLEADYQDGELCVHEGYFSGDRGSKDDREAEGVDTILNDKKKLLSLEEPLRFVFSVWALQEGWDNPNVFNICKLSDAGKHVSRQQQVGRGLRIAVDQRWQRMTEDRLAERHVNFYDVNDLNVVVSAYEHAFIEEIQREIHDTSPSIVDFVVTLAAMGKAGLTDTECVRIYSELSTHGIIDANGNRNSSIQDFLESNRKLFPDIEDKRFAEIVRTFQDTRGAVMDRREPKKTVRVRLGKWKEFRDLWESINRESRIVYKGVDDDDIIRAAAKAFNEAHIPKAQIKITRCVYDSQNDKTVEEKVIVAGDAGYFRRAEFHQNVMNMAKDNRWPIEFLLKLFNRIDTAKYKSNPAEAERRLTDIIQETVHSAVLEKVEYQFAETTVYGNGLQDGDGRVKNSLYSTDLGKYFNDETPRKEFLYDTAVWDSEIERKSILDDSVEYEYDDDKSRNITVFAKLPHIKIHTPFKMYNPDFAYVVKDGSGQTLFLVVETKGYDSETEVPEDQKKKIDYGRRFFESLQKTLPADTKVRFRRRLNLDGMSEILQGCYSG